MATLSKETFRTFRRSAGIALGVLALAVPAPRAEDDAGYRRAAPGYAWSFPRDHGSHPAYETEWWYYTGHLDLEEEARTVGFHLTFFRTAMSPPEAPEARATGAATGALPDSAFALRQMYWTHFAITDIDGATFDQSEMLVRNFPGVGEASTEGLDVRAARWRAEATPEGAMRLRADLRDEESGRRWAIDLNLTPTVGPILHGEAGFSRKGPGDGQASMYYSMPRLRVNGTLAEGKRAWKVGGDAWMDHEFMTNSLGDDQEGWDWFAIQLDDGSEVMLCRLRQLGGASSDSSGGTYVAPNGTVAYLPANSWTVEETGWWDSPHTGVRYPQGWTIEIPRLDMSLSIRATLADQEMRPHRVGDTSYWEGSVIHEGRKGESKITGRGYTELVGYGGRFRHKI